MRGVALLSIIVLLLLCNGFAQGAASTQAPKTPGDVVAYIAMTVVNSQNTPSPVPYQQMISVNSSAYSRFEAANLQNVEFFYVNGTLIPSWLESGATNSAVSTVYWLKLDEAVPADSNLTVFMGFGALSTNFFNQVSTGEAPQLSPTYAQYDDGGNVFQFYDNFQQSSLSSAWSTNLNNDSYSSRDGLTIDSGYVATISSYNNGYTFDAYVTSMGDANSIGFFDLGAPVGHASGAYEGAFIRTSCGSTYPDQWNASEANACGKVYGSLLPGVEDASGIYSVSLLSNYSSSQSYNYLQGNSTQPISVDGPGYPLSAGFVVGGGNPISVQWARVRASPPDGIMPSVDFGTVTSITSQLQYVEYGAIIAAVVVIGVLVYRLRRGRGRAHSIEDYLQPRQNTHRLNIWWFIRSPVRYVDRERDRKRSTG